MIRELLIVMGITYLGNFLSKFSPIPFPGAVIGLIILFFLLLKKIVLISDVEKTTNVLLGNLSFIFLPPGIALINTIDEISHVWMKLLFLIVATTILTLLATGFTVQYIIKKQVKKEIIWVQYYLFL